MMNEPRFCQYCGSAMEPDWQFCENCGGQPAVPEQAPTPEAAPTIFHPPVKVTAPPESFPRNVPPAPQPSRQIPAQKKSSSKWLLPVTIGCFAVFCCCIFIAGFVYLMRNPVSGLFSAIPTSVAEIPVAVTEIPVELPTDLPTPTDLVPPTDWPTAEEQPTATAASEPTPWPTAEVQGLTGNQYEDALSFFDDFSSNALGWPEYDDGLTILQYEEGAYSFQITEADYFDWAYAPVDFWPNSIQFQVWGLPGAQEGTFGVFCQYQDIDNYYYIEIDLETREFIMGQYLAGEFVPLTIPDENGQHWLEAAPLTQFPDEVNQIDLTCTQEFLVLAINDALVYHATPTNPFTNPGEMAFFVYTYSFAGPEGYKVFFDNVSVQNMIQ